MRPRNRFTAVMAVAAWLASPGVAWPAGHWSDLFRAAKPPHPAVVRIIAPSGDSLSLGSGALVAVSGQHGLVLTNWHVVRDATGVIQVAFPDGFRSPALVLKTDAEWDLAALAIWRPRVEPIPLATQAPRPGDPLTIAGYGSGVYREVTGRCTQYVAPGVNQPFEMVELSARARQGDSGGPILNARGELAGVLFGASFSETTGSYCGRVRQFLATVADDFQRLQPVDTLLAQSNPAGPPAGQPSGAPPHLPGGTSGPPSSGAVPAAFAGQAGTQGWMPIVGPRHAGPSSGASGHSQPEANRPPPIAGRARATISAPGPLDVARSGGVPSANGRPYSPPQAAIAASPPPAVPVPPEAVAVASGPEASGSTSARPPTPFEQARNVLAAIGAFALFFHGLRLFLAGRSD